ncbi:hypothetical protein HXK64_02815 [Candidatus Gracilibacteria bacterium]|nr:hypothetical protein [Candidatus Gracilibacteria bacterium]
MESPRYENFENPDFSDGNQETNVGLEIMKGMLNPKQIPQNEEPDLALESLKNDYDSVEANTGGELESLKSSVTEKSSIRYVGEKDVTFFKEQFGVETSQDFYKKVIEMQKEAELDVDGIIGPKTLEYIYKIYYSKLDKAKLPVEILYKLNLGEYFSDYEKHKNKQLPLSGLRNPFSKKYFYGEGIGENISGTFISQDLQKFFESNGEQPGDSSLNGGNSIQIERNSAGKYYLALYVDGKLEVLTYVSPGTPEHKTPENTLSKVRGLRKYNVSGSYPERENEPSGGAIMPMSYQIDEAGAIFGHIGDVNGNGLSHGCIRTPAFYQQAIFSTLAKKTENHTNYKDFVVKVGKLY